MASFSVEGSFFLRTLESRHNFNAIQHFMSTMHTKHNHQFNYTSTDRRETNNQRVLTRGPYCSQDDAVARFHGSLYMIYILHIVSVTR